jgi:catechol 2,3-dioxygenase-like lactoylglutathione lyase family enzyme
MTTDAVAALWQGRAEPILPSSSLPRTLAFWNAIGFTTGLWTDDEGYAWVYPGSDPHAGIYMDYILTEDLDPFSHFGSAYLTVPDVDAVYASIVASGVAFDAVDDEGLFRYSLREIHELHERGGSLGRVTRPIDQVWNKREIALFDPDNNIIRIGSAI